MIYLKILTLGPCCLEKVFFFLTTFLYWFYVSSKSLGVEKAMATHSSTLAWKIPWMDKPGRLQSMGSQRVGHD